MTKLCKFKDILSAIVRDLCITAETVYDAPCNMAAAIRPCRPEERCIAARHLGHISDTLYTV